MRENGDEERFESGIAAVEEGCRRERPPSCVMRARYSPAPITRTSLHWYLSIYRPSSRKSGSRSSRAVQPLRHERARRLRVACRGRPLGRDRTPAGPGLRPTTILEAASPGASGLSVKGSEYDLWIATEGPRPAALLDAYGPVDLNPDHLEYALVRRAVGDLAARVEEQVDRPGVDTWGFDRWRRLDENLAVMLA